MGPEKPLVGVHVLAPLDESQPRRATVGHEQVDPVHHAQGVARQRCLAREGKGLPPGPLAGVWLVGPGLADADLLRQGRPREKAEARLAPVDDLMMIANLKVVMLQDHACRGGHAGQAHAGREGAGVRADGFMQHGLASQVAEGEVFRAGQRRTDVGRQPAARLQRHFQEDGEGHPRLALGGEVPGVGGHVVFRLGGSPGDHLPRLGVHADDAVEEQEGRPRQAGDDALAVEDAVRLAEGLRRLADRKRQEAIPGEHARGRGALPLPQGCHRFAVEAGQAHRHVGDLDDGLAVGVQERVCESKRGRAVAAFLQGHFAGQGARRGRHLAAALQAAGHARHRLTNHLAPGRHPAHAEQEDPQCMQTALIHERAGHDLVIDEVTGEEPVVGMDIGVGADQADAEAAAARVEVADAMDQSHPAAGQAKRFR